MWAAFLACTALLNAAGFEWPGAAAVDAQELASIDRLERQRAAERLAIDGEGGPATRAGLVSLLGDADAQVRVTAARILARAGAAEAIDAATRWTTSAAPSERRLGLDVLRECPAPLSPTARRAIERSLADSEATVRLLAIDALARQPDPKPSLLAIASASEDENRDVRLRAIRLLGASRDRRAAMPLLSRLADSDRQVRAEAIAALGDCGDRGATAALLRQLVDPADDVRIAAALALGKLQVNEAVPALVALAGRLPTDEVARQAILALGDIGGAASIAALIDRLREPPLIDEVGEALRRAGRDAIPPLLAEATGGSAASRTAAAALLGRLRAGTGGADRRVTRTLTSMVERRDVASLAAVEALGAIGDPEAVATLVKSALDPLPELRRATYQALIAIGDDRALMMVERGLADRDARVRRLALRLAGELGARTPATLAAMVARLADGDRAVRDQALAALLTSPPRIPGAAAALLALLARTDDQSAARIGDALEVEAAPADDAAMAAAAPRLTGAGRAAVARGLAAAHVGAPIADPAVIDLLLGLLAPGGVIAEAAADALGRARPLPAAHQAAVLWRAFADAEPAVRARLCAALAPLGGEAGRRRLAQVIEDPDQPSEVRAAAAWAAPEAATIMAGGGAESSKVSASLRDALNRAGASSDPALANNARAALARLATPAAGSARGPGGWAGARVLASDGAPLPCRWLSLVTADGTTVWARTGLDGVARIYGLPPGPHRIEMVDPRLSLQTPQPPSDR